MKKTLALLISALLCLSLFLTACGGGVDTPAASTADSSSVATSDSTPAASADATILRLTHHDPPQSATGKFLDA